MYVTRQILTHTYLNACVCACVCACILCCRCRFRLAQRNLFLAQLWRGEAKGWGGRRVTDGRSQQSLPRRSRVEPIRTSRGTLSSLQLSPCSLKKSERALYLTPSLSVCQSLSSHPPLPSLYVAACAGIKCIPHEWIAEIRAGSQRVRCLTWIKAKSLAAGVAAPYSSLFSGALPPPGEWRKAARDTSIQPSMQQALVMSMSSHRCHYQFASNFNYLIFLCELSNWISAIEFRR